MSDISPYFARAEFACHCGCGFDTVDTTLLKILEAIRDHFKVAVTINSGCRCPKENKSVGGVPNSKHLVGRAADITVRNISASAVADFVERTWPDRYGVGRYNTFTHVDSREIPARWRG